MATKKISSTQVQNNFGQVLDDVTYNQTRFIIERRGIPKAVMISFDDFERLLSNESERSEMSLLLREVKPTYQIGQALSGK
jgi:prevent-host-death family protein